MSAVNDTQPSRGRNIYMVLLAAFAMAYGWRYRGTVGHEGGATIPGALLALAVCLASRRADWRRRAAVAGLFGAVGWAWGGSLSYMEHAIYITTDSFPDVLYGTACFFFLGALWAGIGGAVLGLAFTLPRSSLRRLVKPFIVVCTAFLATYLFLFFNPVWEDLYSRTTAEHFSDADAYAALIVIVVSGLYALARPRERSEALLLLACGVAWWVGYLCLTKFGGLRLGPPYRSEGWGGVLGILLVLIGYLVRQRNRAALMLSLYGLIGGGAAFSMAYTLLRGYAEETVGFVMGLGMALGVQRLERDGLAPAEEDESAVGLDVFAVFVMLVALLWINLRRAPMRWMNDFQLFTDKPVVGLMPWAWFVVAGAVLTLLALRALYLYANGRLPIVPANAVGKAMLIFVLMIWLTAMGSFAMELPNPDGITFPRSEFTLIALASVSTALLLWRPRADAQMTVEGALPSDPRWRVGHGYALTWVCVPFLILVCTGVALYNHDGPGPIARLRFGPDAYWRRIEQLVNPWRLVGFAAKVGDEPQSSAEGAPKAIEFKRDRTVVAITPNNETIGDTHTWQHKDSKVWLEWFSRKPKEGKKASLPMTLQNNRLYIPWPPMKDSKTYAVYECEKGHIR